MANIGKAVKLGVFTLAIMNVTAVVSLRGLPAEAVYGLSSAFYYLFAAIVFLIPTSLVAAELAAMFQDKQGGVFRWVGAVSYTHLDVYKRQVCSCKKAGNQTGGKRHDQSGTDPQ